MRDAVLSALFPFACLKFISAFVIRGFLIYFFKKLGLYVNVHGYHSVYGPLKE